MNLSDLVPLREVVARYIGGGWGKDEPSEAYDSPAWVIRGTDFASVRSGTVSGCPFRYHKASNVESRRLESGDIVFEVSGGSKDQPVGRSLLVTPHTLNKFNGDVMCASFCKLIRPDKTKVDPAFLYWFLQSIYDNRAITQYQVQSTGISNFQFEPFLDDQLVPFPDRATQRRIASVLSAYDQLIENNTRRIEILEEMAQAIYREWFVEFRYPGHEDVRLVDSDYGPIPHGWRVASLCDLVEERKRSVEPSSLAPDTAYVGLEHMPEHSIAISSWGRAEDAGSRKYRYEAGEILFGKIRPYFHKVGIPPVAGICSTDAIVIRPRQASVAGLALAVVSSDAFVDHAVQTSNGTKMPRANWSVLERYPVSVPPEPLLMRFAGFMSDTVDLIHGLIMMNRNLHATRDLLLPRLISGEVDVSDLDIDSEEAVV